MSQAIPSVTTDTKHEYLVHVWARYGSTSYKNPPSPLAFLDPNKHLHVTQPGQEIEDELTLVDGLRRKRKLMSREYLSDDDLGDRAVIVVSELLARETESLTERVAKAREELAKPIEDALEDGRGELSDETVLAANDMLDAADQFQDEHEVLTYVTSDNDAITKVSDWLGNYVVMKSRSDDKSVVHFKMRSYKEFERRDQAKAFALSLLGCLKSRPTES